MSVSGPSLLKACSSTAWHVTLMHNVFVQDYTTHVSNVLNLKP